MFILGTGLSYSGLTVTPHPHTRSHSYGNAIFTISLWYLRRPELLRPKFLSSKAPERKNPKNPNSASTHMDNNYNLTNNNNKINNNNNNNNNNKKQQQQKSNDNKSNDIKDG